MTTNKREAFRIVSVTGGLAGSSATREAAEKRAGQWSRSKRFAGTFVVMTDDEYRLRCRPLPLWAVERGHDKP